MTKPVFDLAARLKDKARLDADDTLAMRRLAWPDGKIDDAEVDAIFDLNTTVRDSSPEWVDFFVEALTDYIVRQQSPAGYVDERKAAWLMAKIDHDGRVESNGELELLVKILEVATNAPERLKSYTLRQIEAAVQTGAGPTRDGGTLDPGSINATEARLLRRVLFAQAGDGPAVVSRAEAEMLFRIKNATLASDNAPEWKTLFVQAVGNHLMAHTTYRPLTADRALALDAFMNDTRVDVGNFLRRMTQSSFSDGLAASRDPAGVAGMDAFADDGVDASEIAWAKSEISADGNFDPLEEALVAFVVKERGVALT